MLPYKLPRAPCFRHPWRRAALFYFERTPTWPRLKARGHGAQRDRQGAARSVRREGRIPAVLYGGGEAPTPIALERKNLTQLIFAGHFLTTIFELDIDGKKERAIPRDYQLDVVKDTPLHVDFLRLKPGSRIRLSVTFTLSIKKARQASSVAAR